MFLLKQKKASGLVKLQNNKIFVLYMHLISITEFPYHFVASIHSTHKLFKMPFCKKKKRCLFDIDFSLELFFCSNSYRVCFK